MSLYPCPCSLSLAPCRSRHPTQEGGPAEGPTQRVAPRVGRCLAFPSPRARGRGSQRDPPASPWRTAGRGLARCRRGACGPGRAQLVPSGKRRERARAALVAAALALGSTSVYRLITRRVFSTHIYHIASNTSLHVNHFVLYRRERGAHSKNHTTDIHNGGLCCRGTGSDGG